MTQRFQRFTKRYVNVLGVLIGLAVVSSILIYSGCGMTSSPKTPTPTPTPDTTPPTSTITSPTEGAVVLIGKQVAITGTASDAGGGSVVRVEVSVDGGANYSAATGTNTWSFNWTPSAAGPATIKSRAVDNSGNVQNPPAEIHVTVDAPPTSIITSPIEGATITAIPPITITGTASDAGGGTVVRVEVSVDGGGAYNAATGTNAWSFNWTPSAPGPATIKSRAVDNTGNVQNPPTEIHVIKAPTTFRVPSDRPTIQSAINDAIDSDRVLVAPGTYVENINFGGKSITVRSESGSEVTTIDGRNGGSVVSFTSGEGRDSVLNGFTLENGSARIDGGGILVQNSSPTITNNRIRNNRASFGGGIQIYAGSPLIQGNTITGNRNDVLGGGGGGGGITIGGTSSAEVLDNIISDNGMNASNGGGIYMFGAGNPIIKRNIIKGNTVGSKGGGICIMSGDGALIVQNLITGNQASEGGGIYWQAFGSRGPIFVNNTIADNDATLGGSGIFADGFDRQTTLVNNIIVANPGQVGFHCGASPYQNPPIDQNPPIIRFNNTFSAGGTAYGGTCSDMTGTDGNISADPLFTNPTQGDYHLQFWSPSIDAGDNQTPNLPDTDMDGDPRILDGDGNGIATIDMGVDEFLLPPGLTWPISTIRSPGEGATVSTGITISITGLARNAGGAPVARVEVSVDGGVTWSAATGTTAWSYDWTPATPGPATIKSRAVGDSGNVQDPPAEITVTVRTPVIIRAPSEYLTIQEAIDAAGYGDTVLVAPGIYHENIDFRGKAITVRSESGRDVTTIDGGNTDSVVIFTSGEQRNSVLNGFTLQNGKASFDRSSEGGGIVIRKSSPTIINNKITNNHACQGGGIGIHFGSPLIQGNTITSNGGNLCSVGLGSGISIRGASFAEILDNEISENTGSYEGGGIYMSVAITPIVKRNIIRGNNASQGGGIYLERYSYALIVQNLITGNQATFGAGIYWSNAGLRGPILVNNTIADNDATSIGFSIGVIGVDARMTLINNIIVAKPGQMGFNCDTSSNQNLPIIRFNNIYSAGGMAYGGDCPDMTGTNGNISADPLFTNPTLGDYHLQLGSLSIDTGDNQTPNLPDMDLDGHPRILDGDGNGTATIDMGVYEFLLPSGLKISLLDVSNPGSRNSRALFICDLRPWTKTPGRRPKNPISARPTHSMRLRVE